MAKVLENDKKTNFSSKSQPGACLAVCLIFGPISAWRAYKLRAYKKKVCTRFEALRHTLFFFYKHAVFKHARLKLAKKLSTLLSTPQAEILGKKIILYYFSSVFAMQGLQNVLKYVFF